MKGNNGICVFHFQLIGETLPEDDPDRDVLWELIDHLYTLLDPSIDAPLRLFPFLRFLPIKHGRIFKETIRVRDRVAKRFMDTQKVSYSKTIVYYLSVDYLSMA